MLSPSTTSGEINHNIFLLVLLFFSFPIQLLVFKMSNHALCIVPMVFSPLAYAAVMNTAPWACNPTLTVLAYAVIFSAPLGFSSTDCCIYNPAIRFMFIPKLPSVLSFGFTGWLLIVPPLSLCIFWYLPSPSVVSPTPYHSSIDLFVVWNFTTVWIYVISP